MNSRSKFQSLKFACLSLLCSFSFFAPYASAKSAGGSSLDGWLLNLSSNYAGTVDCQIAMEGIRMKMVKLGLVVLTKAPKWDLYVYNESNKNSLELPYSEWKNKLSFGKFQMGSKKKMPEFKPVPEKTGKIMTLVGHKAQEFVLKRPNPKTNKLETFASIWMTNEIKAPPQFGELVHNFMNVPSIEGTPLRVTQNKYGKTIQDLDAVKVQKTKIAESSFEPQKGYKKVKDEMALMLGDTEMDMIGGMPLPPK